MRESEIEKYLRLRVEQEGGMALKFVSPSFSGVADRIVCLPDGQTWFVELKAAKGRLSPLQVYFGEEMIRMNQNYAVLKSREEVDAWLDASLGL